jgi:two-component system, response regulator
MQKLFLVVDDSLDDVSFFKRAVKDAGLSNAVHWVPTGAEAVLYLTAEGKYCSRKQYPFPSIMFLDLTLQDVTGFDFLTTVRSHYSSRQLLIVVLAGSGDPAVPRASKLGADAFIRKPARPEDFTDLAAQFPSHF